MRYGFIPSLRSILDVRPLCDALARQSGRRCGAETLPGHTLSNCRTLADDRDCFPVRVSTFETGLATVSVFRNWRGVMPNAPQDASRDSRGTDSASRPHVMSARGGHTCSECGLVLPMREQIGKSTACLRRALSAQRMRSARQPAARSCVGGAG